MRTAFFGNGTQAPCKTTTDRKICSIRKKQKFIQKFHKLFISANLCYNVHSFYGGKMLAYLVNFLKALNSNSKPSQIANSFCIGLILGFMPKNNLLWYILFIFFAFVRINKCGYYIMTIIGTLTAYLIDPLFDKIGYAILTFAPLENFYAWALDIPFVGFTKFNNTIVAGSLVFGLLAYIPFFLIMYLLIKLWRKHIAPRFNDSKVLKTIYQIPVVGKIASKAAELI